MGGKRDWNIVTVSCSKCLGVGLYVPPSDAVFLSEGSVVKLFMTSYVRDQQIRILFHG